ncbi:hypothetical protein SAMN05216266_114122 [Amycolatopsis marina]|uniref:Uncharacterized protein n=1 Tax=Amycolatopsis marina TaxID=490629 RepID=A0A1I1BJL2_9PSEU|nr:hypothetical protein [Amycolatopsis marina]SFB49952.1 hypothetical protein SAMN05216266_114122 [Amycolatopsis marina]
MIRRVARGLLHDVLITGETAAANEAMETFVDLLLHDGEQETGPSHAGK